MAAELVRRFVEARQENRVEYGIDEQQRAEQRQRSVQSGGVRGAVDRVIDKDHRQKEQQREQLDHQHMMAEQPQKEAVN